MSRQTPQDLRRGIFHYDWADITIAPKSIGGFARSPKLAFAGNLGTAISGHCGTAISGLWGRSATGDGGLSIIDARGAGRSGEGGLLVFWDSALHQYAAFKVGENGIKPDTLYRLTDGAPVLDTDTEILGLG